MRYFVRLPPTHESNPHKLIEICPGCARTLHVTGKILLSDKCVDSNPFPVQIYDLKDLKTLEILTEETPLGLHHIERG